MGPSQTLILHWNGKAWSRMDSADPGGPGESNDLTGIAAWSSSNVWTVGDSDDSKSIAMAFHCC